MGSEVYEWALAIETAVGRGVIRPKGSPPLYGQYSSDVSG
jgi:hypothetical protein